MRNFDKTNSILSLALLIAFIFVGTINASAQENNSDGKKKVRVKTVKIINGQKVEKDTTFFVEEGNDNFTWNSEEGKEFNVDSLFLTVELEEESDGKTKKMIFITDDGETHNLHFTDDSLSKKELIIKSTSDSEINENIFFFSDDANLDFTSYLNEIKVESIEKIELVNELNKESNKNEKVVKLTIKTPDGKTEEKIIKDNLSWSDCSSKKIMKIKKDVDVTEKNGVKIIKIKTIDQDGNEKVEIKEIKTDTGKDLIWIEEEGSGKINVNIEVETDGEYKTITTTKTDEKGNKTVEVKKVKLSNDEDDLEELEKDIKKEKKKGKKKSN